MENNFQTEHRYLKAKKRVKELKGFYIHLVLYVLCTPIIIVTNLMFVPEFHYFWFSVLGWGIAIGIHGFTLIGLGNHWEEKKIKELMDDPKF